MSTIKEINKMSKAELKDELLVLRKLQTEYIKLWKLTDELLGNIDDMEDSCQSLKQLREFYTEKLK